MPLYDNTVNTTPNMTMKTMLNADNIGYIKPRIGNFKSVIKIMYIQYKK